MASLRGLAAPRGLPVAIRERLVSAIERAAADPALRVQAEKVFAPLRYLGPAAYEAELRSAEAVFRQMWKETPWTDR
jgi:tripartite-type tricarboxylate transporter receptor subunit TctC